MNNARLIFYPPSLAKNTCLHVHIYDPLCSTTANPWLAKMYFIVNYVFNFPIGREDTQKYSGRVSWFIMLIVAALLSSICFHIRKKIDDIVWKTKSKIWKWLNHLYSMKLKKKIPGCQYNILYIHLFDVLWKGP